MNKSTKKLFTGILISLALIGLILWRLSSESELQYHIDQILLNFDGDNYLLILCIILMAPMSWIIESLKWRYLVKKIQKITPLTALASVLTGMSFAMVTPGKVGDFAGRILYLKDNIRLRGTIATLVGSFAHMVVTCLMGVIGLIVVVIHHPGMVEWTLLSIALVAGALVGWMYFNIGKFQFRYKNKKNWFRKFLTALKILKRYDQRDLRKILLFSLLKLCTYTTQFVLVTYLFGSDLPFYLSFFTALAKFWVIMIIPSFFIADVVIRGVVANLLFVESGISNNSTPILAGTYIIWLINWVLPSIIGALSLMLHRIFSNKQS